MSATVGDFRELVQQAHDGELKLPGFQRNWRWRTDKVVKLYDSLRLRYPIGSFLFLSGSGQQLAPRHFNGSSEAAATTATRHLVLDGQQRLTAGIHIFFATGPRQYFLDLKKLRHLFEDSNIDIANSSAVSEHCEAIDYTDGYITSKPRTQDPRAFLITDDLLCTSILTNAVECSVAIGQYNSAKPEHADFMLRVVQPYFTLNNLEKVPHINIDEKTSTSAISRIFTTLNSTGQMLTPFELVVASLFPYDIHLQQEVADYREAGTYYPQMDRTGEILLQTIAMFDGVDQKKTNLPKNINNENYTQHKQTAFIALENLGHFLTNSLGCGLNTVGDLVPYDAIYAPMAKALQHVANKGLTGPDLAEAHKKLRVWFAASTLTQRYQEGVHNKQSRDFKEMVAWIDGVSGRPAWMDEARIPSLGRSINGAIGKFVQCCINQLEPQDPVVKNHNVGFRAGAMTTEKHHIYPSKFVQNIDGWDKKTDTADTLLNMMFVERGTNKRWLNHDPKDHISEAKKNMSRAELLAIYRRQFISEEAFSLLEKPEKNRDDFLLFLQYRQNSISEWITESFGIPPLTGSADADDEELVPDDEFIEAL